MNRQTDTARYQVVTRHIQEENSVDRGSRATFTSKKLDDDTITSYCHDKDENAARYYEGLSISKTKGIGGIINSI